MHQNTQECQRDIQRVTEQRDHHSGGDQPRGNTGQIKCHSVETSGDTRSGKSHRKESDITQYIGKTADNIKGKVKIGSEIWSARSLEPIDEGKSVIVVSAEGVHVVVEECTEE